MDRKTAEAIGLLRHRIISPVLMESGRSQIAYFKKISEQEFEVPGHGGKRFSPSTMKSWLRKYKKYGFKGIIPKTRKDRGSCRKIQEQEMVKIEMERKNNLDISVKRFYEICFEKNLLGIPPICLATLGNILKLKGLHRKIVPVPRKRFEMSKFGELWTGDFMHGPSVVVGKQKKKAILFAIIDDYSRVIVGAEFAFNENTGPVEIIFKHAILSFGLPDRLYVDNGPAFSSEYLARICASLGIGLVHSKPYDSPSRGKIERFFRTVREGFLCLFLPDAVINLDELNEKFNIWLRDKYHHEQHRGIQTRPIDRYQQSITEFPLKRVDRDILNEHFMSSAERTVNKDGTISYKGIVFEVPSKYIGKRIEIRHPQDSVSELYIYENNERICHIRKLDSKENGRLYRPSPEQHAVSFQKNDKERS